MKQRLITSVIALSLLATIPAWGQTSVIKRSKTIIEKKAEAETETRRQRIATEREAEHVRVEQERANIEQERQRLARIAKLDEQDAPAVARGELVILKDSFKYLGSEYHYDCITYGIKIKEGHGIIVERNRKAHSTKPSGQIIVPARARLGEIYYPITEISHAFYEWDSVSQIISVRLPSSIKEINFGAFENSLLQSINLPEGLMYLGYWLESGKVFKDCIQLESIKFPQSLLRIGDHCFDGSGIKEIRIPKNVRYIGSCAFQDCKELTSVFFDGEPDTIQTQPFLYCTKLKHISMPNTLFERLKSKKKSIWSAFGIKACEITLRYPDGTSRTQKW